MFRRISLALLIGVLGGSLFAYADLPLPWMLGAMAGTMAASLAGADILVPQSLRKPMIGLVGVTLGSAFTPDRLEHINAWLPSLSALPVYVLLIGGLILFYLRRVSPFDSKTAFFAAMPGGLSEMVILSDQLKADMRNVALFHTARLVLIVFSIPLLASLVVTVPPDVGADDGMLSIDPLALLVTAGLLAAGWLLAIPLRLPSPSFMGPLLLSSIVHLAGMTDASTPLVVVALAQLVIGASVGSRFSGVPFQLIIRTLGIGAGGTLLMFAVTLVFALILNAITDSPLPLLLLALIPGGFPEMSLIALGLGFDPAFVVTHHGIRVLLVVALALPLFRLLSKFDWFTRQWPAGSNRQDVTVSTDSASEAPCDADPQPSPTVSGRRARR